MGSFRKGDNSSWKPHDTNFKIAKELVFGNKNNALEKAFKKAKDTNLGRELTQNMNNFNRTRNDEEKRQHPQINKMINQTLRSLPNSSLNIDTPPYNLTELLNKTRDTLENLTKLERRVKRLESFHETYRVGGYIKKKKSKTKKRKKKSKTKKRKTKRRRKSKTKKRIKRKRI
jgi:hypothetical protein